MRTDSANIAKFRLARTTTPSSPASGYVYFYVKDSDGKAYIKNSSGVETEAGAAAGTVLLDDQTASSSAVLDFTSMITAAYDEYLFEFLNLIPATNAVDLWVRLSTDNGSTFDSGNSYNITVSANDQATPFVAGQAIASPTAAFKLRDNGDISNNANYGVCGYMRLFSPLGALYKRINYRVSYLSTATTLFRLDGDGVYKSATATDAIRFLMSSGNIASGIIRMYGIAK